MLPAFQKQTQSIYFCLPFERIAWWKLSNSEHSYKLNKSTKHKLASTIP